MSPLPNVHSQRPLSASKAFQSEGKSYNPVLADCEWVLGQEQCRQLVWVDQERVERVAKTLLPKILFSSSSTPSLVPDSDKGEFQVEFVPDETTFVELGQRSPSFPLGKNESITFPTSKAQAPTLDAQPIPRSKPLIPHSDTIATYTSWQSIDLHPSLSFPPTPIPTLSSTPAFSRSTSQSPSPSLSRSGTMRKHSLELQAWTNETKDKLQRLKGERDGVKSDLNLGNGDKTEIGLGRVMEVQVSKEERHLVEWIFLVTVLNFSFWSDVELEQADDSEGQEEDKTVPETEESKPRMDSDTPRCYKTKESDRAPLGTNGHKGLEQRSGKAHFNQECSSSSKRKKTIRFGVVFSDKKGVKKRWTGYRSLLAVINRALEDGYPITSPNYLLSVSEEELRWHFRPDTDPSLSYPHESEPIPLLDLRLKAIKLAYKSLQSQFHSSPLKLVSSADGSALKLITTFAENIATFKDEGWWPAKERVLGGEKSGNLGRDGFEDEAKGERRKIRFWKRAQIFVAEIWAAFEDQGLGRFDDIDQLTMFADYRLSQFLHSISILKYSDPLQSLLLQRRPLLPNGSLEEMCIRAAGVIGVERVRKEMERLMMLEDLETIGDSKGMGHTKRTVRRPPTAVEIDFWMWEECKRLEAENEDGDSEDGEVKLKLPHHRTRSWFY